MTESILWMFAFLVLYWTFCIAWGVRCGRTAVTASDYFIADRRLPPWIFVLAASAISLSGWVILGLPGLVFRDGFPAAYAALAAITIPLAGTLFLKRQWMLGRRYGYVTPSEMFGDYFGGEGIRWLVALIALVFAVPFAGVQLMAGGFVISLLSGGSLNADLVTWVLAVPLIIYLALGGLRGVAFAGVLQCGLLAAGIFGLGLATYIQLGGLDPLLQGISGLAASDLAPWAPTAKDQSPYTTVPGVIQFTRGLGEQLPVGGLWTGVMTLSLLLAFMGVQASPTFSMWAFAARSPSAFGTQQVWISAVVFGALLLFFGIPQGIAAHFLGANGAAAEIGLASSAVLPELASNEHEQVVPALIAWIGQTSPWFTGLLAVCVIAALQASTSAHLSATSGVFARDIYLRHLRPGADADHQKRAARIFAGLMILTALLLATFAVDALVVLGALALAMGFQLLPALAAVCWFPWITRQGATAGLAFGLLAVIMTEHLGGITAAFFGLDLPWGRWPWTIHSAVWGMFFNLVTCAVISLISQDSEAREHRSRYHVFLAEHAGLAPEKRPLRPVAWSLLLLWLFFAVGPGTVLGNDFFGLPGAGREGWGVGMPSIWVWQIIGWALGILVLWFLAYRLELASGAHVGFEPLREDIASTYPAEEHPQLHLREPAWYWSFAIGVTVIVIAQWTFG